MRIAPPLVTKHARIPKAWKNVIERWTTLPSIYSEADLEHNLVFPMFNALGFSGLQLRKGASINQPNKPGLKPDSLVYQDTNEPPILVVEVKKRDAALGKCSEQDFAATCSQNMLYKDAVGLTGNGVRQYLNVELVKPKLLASYGLVFNGDFFQLWRRVDGLVFPLTPVQKVTKSSLSSLMRQLECCLKTPPWALVSAVWNQKGGVAKTTNIINLGATLALQGKRVLLVDFDLQGDLTRGLGVTSLLPNYLEICTNKLLLKDFDDAKSILNAAIQVRQFPTSDKRSYQLSVLSADKAAMEGFRDSTDIDHKLVFKGLIGLLAPDYDYIFIDASPAPDKLTQLLLYVCDTVLIPVDLGSKSLHHAISIYDRIIPKMREIRFKDDRLQSGPWNLGIVFSNCAADAGNQVLGAIAKEFKRKNFTGRQCQTHLKVYAQTKMAEFRNVPVVCWQNSPITKLYNNLTKEVFLNHNFTDH